MSAKRNGSRFDSFLLDVNPGAPFKELPKLNSQVGNYLRPVTVESNYLALAYLGQMTPRKSFRMSESRVNYRFILTQELSSCIMSGRRKACCTQIHNRRSSEHTQSLLEATPLTGHDRLRIVNRESQPMSSTVVPIPPDAPNPLLLDLPAASSAAGLTVWQLRGLIAAGDIPVVKVGRKLYVRRTTLQRWVERAEQKYRAA